MGLDMLPLQVRIGAIKVKEDRALVKFLGEELWTVGGRRLCANGG